MKRRDLRAAPLRLILYVQYIILGGTKVTPLLYLYLLRFVLDSPNRVISAY